MIHTALGIILTLIIIEFAGSILILTTYAMAAAIVLAYVWLAFVYPLWAIGMGIVIGILYWKGKWHREFFHK